ncbi:MAG: hypothetical protein CM1200mP29_10780 [Verrucomicrobiota bacterium]|nr:MAG: hypothetical protein CM1200mP29_10780 [Verrucomicrobiota bacterium]
MLPKIERVSLEYRAMRDSSFRRGSAEDAGGGAGHGGVYTTRGFWQCSPDGERPSCPKVVNRGRRIWSMSFQRTEPSSKPTLPPSAQCLSRKPPRRRDSNSRVRPCRRCCSQTALGRVGRVARVSALAGRPGVEVGTNGRLGLSERVCGEIQPLILPSPATASGSVRQREL